MLGRLIAGVGALFYLALLYALACDLGRVLDGFVLGLMGMGSLRAIVDFLRGI